MKITFAILIILGLVLVSCDCYRSYSGIVVDAETEKPIEGAIFYSDKKLTYIQSRSDSVGYYQGTIISGNGCFKPHFYTVVAEGYKDTLVEIGKTVLLRK